MNFFFSDPHFFYYFLFLPVVLLLFPVFFFWRRALLKRAEASEILKILSPKKVLMKGLLALLPAFLSLVFIILALGRPKAPLGFEIETSQGVEMMLLVDVSKSMRAQDVRPSRLLLLKTQLGRFVASSKSRHRMGLIVFAGSSFLVSPLTSDLGLIQMNLESLSTHSASAQGTRLAPALDHALQAFEGGGLPQAAKALLIASDGEDHETGALEKMKEIHKKGIHVFTLGFGTKKGGKIPLEDGSSQRDENGRVVITRFKDRLLREYAKIGKGVFYHVGSEQNFTLKLEEDLQKLNQHNFEEQKKRASKELFQSFALTAFLLSLVHLLFHFLWGRKGAKGGVHG